MNKSITNNIGSKVIPFALSFSSIAVAGSVNSYYRVRTGYSGNYNKSLIEAGYNPISSNKIFNNYNDQISHDHENFHFSKGRIVRELVIVDDAVQDKHVFYKLSNPFSEVVEIKKGSGILGLFNKLSKYRDLESVHIVSHGKSGSLQIGGEELTRERLEKNLDAFTAINRSIKSGGDLLLYGCEVAEGKDGNDLLQIIKGNTHVDVAASDDLTGNADFNGDWDLEIQLGDIDAVPVNESIAMKDFTGVLQFVGDVIASAAGGFTDGDTEALISNGETVQFPQGKFYNTSNPYVKFSGTHGFQQMKFKSDGSFTLSGDLVVYNDHNYSVKVGVYGYNTSTFGAYGLYWSALIPSKSETTLNFENDFGNISLRTIHYMFIGARNSGDTGINPEFLIRGFGVKDAPGPLPVELTGFSGRLIDNSVVLEWETATETNNYGFDVERQETGNSTQNAGWEKIGFVQGHGNSNSPKSYEFIDASPFGENPPAENLRYRLKQIDTDGTYEYYSLTAEVDATITSVNDERLPEQFHLSQNYPNPFNPTTTIKYSVPVVDVPSPAGRDKLREGQHVSLKIYDILGNEVSQLVNKSQAPGIYQVEFNASNLPSGTYFYKLEAGSFSGTKKMILIK